MKTKEKLTILIAIVIFGIMFGFVAYKYSSTGREVIRMAPKIPEAIMQYSEIAIESQITKYKAAHRPDIVRIDKNGETWIVVVNKLAVQEIQKGAVVRLHIGYCYWESGALVAHGVVFSPDWHPPYNRNRVTVGLLKNNKYLCSARVW